MTSDMNVSSGNETPNLSEYVNLNRLIESYNTQYGDVYHLNRSTALNFLEKYKIPLFKLRQSVLVPKSTDLGALVTREMSSRKNNKK